MSQRGRDWLLLVGFCTFLFFYGTGQFGLVGADEPRYAQIAREMLARHDWVTPTLGGQPWLEKPPLYYWQAMVAYAIFGVHDWSARIPSAVDASLVVLAVYFFLRRLRPGFHLDGALMAASSAGIIGFAHSASTDMPLAAMFTLAMLAWYAWRETSSRGLLVASYGFLALAVLAKGPVAIVLAAMIIVLFAIAAGDRRILLKTISIPGVLTFLAIALPWCVAIQIRQPEFFRVFILEHNLARFGTNLYHHVQPFWYYLPVSLLALIPWTAFVATAVVEVVRAWRSERKAIFETRDALNVFLVLWLLLPILFFSISQSKLPGYILPAIPAGTLLVAEYVRRHVADEARPSRWLTVLHGLIAVAPLVPALMIAYLLTQRTQYWGKGTMIALAIAIVLSVGIALTLESRLGLRLLYFVTLVPTLLTVAAIIKIGAPLADQTLSARSIARQLAAIEMKPLPVAVMGVKRETEYGLHFYRNQTVSRYERHEIPSDEHLLVAPQGAVNGIREFVSGRRIAYLGDFPAQRLSFYWVAAAGNGT